MSVVKGMSAEGYIKKERTILWIQRGTAMKVSSAFVELIYKGEGQKSCTPYAPLCCGNRQGLTVCNYSNLMVLKAGLVSSTFASRSCFETLWSH